MRNNMIYYPCTPRGDQIVFDDYYEEYDAPWGDVWVRMCPSCYKKYQKILLHGEEEDDRAGTCGVCGCSNHSKYLITFNKEATPLDWEDADPEGSRLWLLDFHSKNGSVYKRVYPTQEAAINEYRGHCKGKKRILKAEGYQTRVDTYRMYREESHRKGFTFQLVAPGGGGRFTWDIIQVDGCSDISDMSAIRRFWFVLEKNRREAKGSEWICVEAPDMETAKLLFQAAYSIYGATVPCAAIGEDSEHFCPDYQNGDNVIDEIVFDHGALKAYKLQVMHMMFQLTAYTKRSTIEANKGGMSNEYNTNSGTD